MHKCTCAVWVKWLIISKPFDIFFENRLFFSGPLPPATSPSFYIFTRTYTSALLSYSHLY